MYRLRALPLAPLTASLALIAGCGSSRSGAPHPTQQPQPTSTETAGSYAAYLRRKGYTSDSTIKILLPVSGTAFVVHSTCTGSADGHCQAVDVFLVRHNQHVWHREYTGVLSIARTSSGFSVRAVSYAPQDPLCCPSLPAVTDTYTWTGSSFTESGPLPHAPGA